MADVKWIKITTDIFDDEKILLIESLPDAYSIIVVWFKLLCLAGKQNNSGVFVMSNQIAYTDKMLATIFRMKETTVQLALQTFEQFGMIEIIDGVITIPNWGKHQNMDQLESKKEYMRTYMQEYRAKQKLLAGKTEEESGSKTGRKSNGKTNSKANVSSLDKEGEEEREEEEEKKNNASASFLESVSQIVSFLNEQTGKSYKAASKKTRTLIHARMKEGFTVEDFRTVISKKCADWLNDEKMDRYLRPETLFGTKFEDYLNEKPKGGGPNGGNGKHGRRNAAADGANPEGHDYGVVF